MERNRKLSNAIMKKGQGCNMQCYVLDGKIARQCNSLLEWADWMEKNDCHVAFDEIDGIVISTVFLGLDHNFQVEGDPLLFETMTFLPDDFSGIDQWRYFTWEEAAAGHRKLVDAYRVKKRSAEKDATVALKKILIT